MEVFSSYHEIPVDWNPLVLTIGKFDSVHLGHSSLLEQARATANRLQGHLCVLTFVNHPIEVLKKGSKIQRLCTPIHQLKLMSESGVDGVLLLKFTKQFAKQTAEQFIDSIYQHRPFKALVLGYDARLGSDRQGETSFMYALGDQFGFELHYSIPYANDGIIVSSSLIREAISCGDLALVEKMLGRKYSIVAIAAEETDCKIVVASLANLCLPPAGVYPVTVFCGETEFSARGVIKKEFPFLTLEFDGKTDLVGDKLLKVVFSINS